MFIVHVDVHVKEEFLEVFIQETILNARNSIQEPGIARFDFIQRKDDPTRFMLVEVYRDENAPAKHKETAHYLKWRETVADWMAQPRKGEKHIILAPTEKELW